MVFQACLDTGLDFCQQVLSFQVGTGLVIGKSSALRWTRSMDCAAFNHSVACLKDAGAIIFYLEGMTVFHKMLADLTIRNRKMSGKTVYINRIN